MSTRRAAARRVEEDLSNAGVPPQGNQDPPQDNQAPQGSQALVIPPTMTDGEIRSSLVTLDKTMTTQAQAVATQAQSIMTQAN